MIPSTHVSKFGFKLRTALVLMTATALVAAYVGIVMRQGSQQAELVQSFGSVGGMVYYDFDPPNKYVPNGTVQNSWLRMTLRRMFGNEYYGTAKIAVLANPTLTPDIPLSPSSIDKVRAFPSVTHLRLSNYTITPEAIEIIANLTRLRSLEFFRCVLNDEAILSLASLKQLESLSLSVSSLNCEILEQVCSSLELQDLRLTSFELDSKCLHQLRLSSSLKSLFLWGLTMSDDDLKWIADNLHLKSLRLQNIEGITNKGLAELKASQTLETVEVLNCEGVSDYIGTIKQLP